MNYTNLFCLLLLSTSAFTQNKYNYTWVLGYQNILNSTYHDGCILDFNPNPPTVTYDSIPFAMSSTAPICDKNGQLKFFSNGCAIANAKKEILAHGDSLNPGIKYNTECVEEDGGYFGLQELFFLPFPGDSTRYGLFHINYGDGYSAKEILYSQVRSIGQDDGEVESKNVLLAGADIFDNCITAVRHGNGRDWWIVISDGQGSLIYLFLFDPTGPRLFKTIRVNENSNSNSSTQVCFSADGSRFARWASTSLEIYIFDRCLGDFFCEQVVRRDLFGKSPGKYGGVCFSPSGKYLYLSNVIELFQYDIRDKKILKIGDLDGFLDLIPTWFFIMEAAPDNKIYMGTFGSTHYLHVINFPDSAGAACSFVQHAIQLPTRNSGLIPHFPNFNLVDLKGSPCDTLGLNAPPNSIPTYAFPDNGLLLRPNPATEFVYLSLGACTSGVIAIYNSFGVEYYKNDIIKSTETTIIDVSSWPTGAYFAVVIEDELYDAEKAKYRHVKPFVVIRH